ncbi:hypothetical protein BKK39_05215 [Bacillus cereus]|nr:hypothetical protein CK938_20915 [Bacillus cereus]OJD77253.1 hypothetical protein BAU29_03210 [Bacillus sp. P14-1]OJE27693.1 hypothetical protein BAQ46_09600 [Bacillus paranthracis]OUA67275.1 hypothetical protein BK786_13660 [Bacillus thuringiensis serovar thailandensis]PDY91612.1 hypothetical protein CON09_13105 [Bacillus anthracis]PNS30631.1 hypothetical protein C1640_20680 [Bacillus sp. AKBS9]
MKAEKTSNHNEKRTNTFHYFSLRFFLIKVLEFQNVFIQKKKDRKAVAPYPHLL